MTRAAIYVRISEDRRGTGLGVARQEAECRALAQAKGWDIVAVHTDNDISASKKHVRRPGYEQLLDDIREHRVDAVVAWAHHRLHRRIVELGVFLESYVQPYQLKVAFVGGEIDLSTPSGRTLAKILGAVAEGEIDELRWRVQAKQRELAAAGRVGNGGRRPYGYTPRRTEVIDAEAVVIREIADRVLAGDSLGGIARDLDARGVPACRGGDWTVTSVRAVILKPHVAGMRVYQGQVVGEGTWPAILDRGTWEAVRGVLAAPARLRPGNNTRRWLLSGIATCGLCRAVLGINYGAAGPRYRCRGCGRVSRHQAHLDDYVTGAVLELLADPSLHVDRSPDMAAPVAEITELEARRTQVVLDAATNPRITLLDRDRSLDAIDGRLLQLRDHVTIAARGRVLASVEPMTADEFAGLPLDRQRAIVASLLGIVVHPKSTPGGKGFEPQTVDLVPAFGAEYS